MTTVAPEATSQTPVSRLLSRPHLPLAIGAVALVTLGAFENRAVGTALPTMVRHFHAVGSFGLANAAPVASYVVALVVAGLWADRRGPVSPLRLGMVAFALAQLLVGLAPSMPAVVAGRLLSGLAEAMLDIGLMVLVARVLPQDLRPRMFSLFAAAWVLPSVLGPLVTGVVTEQAGWRWVFLGALALLLPTWLMLRPAVLLVGRVARQHAGTAAGPSDRATGTVPDTAGEDRGRLGVLPWAVAAAVSVFVLTLAGEWLASRPVPSACVIAVSGALLVVSAGRILPPGTAHAEPGLPAVVALRALTGLAFGGVGAFLPLLLTLLHGFTPSGAGVSLSITGVMWALGSWAQGRDHGLPRAVVLRIGMALMTVGLAVTTLLAWPAQPPRLGLAGWALAGVGMGLASSSLSVFTLDLSTDCDQGRNNSAAQMAGSTSAAIAFAGGGTLLAFAAPHPGTVVFAAILGTGALAALCGLLVSGRVVPSTGSSGLADEAASSQ